MSERCRVLFANSGLLGHRSVAVLVADAISSVPEIEARHVDAGTPVSAGERLVRRLACASMAPRWGRGANLDLLRWRAEMHIGVVAARRIRAETAAGWTPDVLHFHTQAAAYRSIPLMRRVPSVVSIDCTQTLAREEMAGRLSRMSYAPNVRRDGAVFRTARAIVATSEWARSDLRRQYPAAAPVTVLQYPVRIDSAAPGWLEQRNGPARPHATLRFLFIGGDFPRKGGWDLLQAWRESGLAATAYLDVVTSWPVPDARVPEGVRVLGGVEPYSVQWRQRWREADVFVMPTRAEAFGMVFQEAAAAGVPAIGTRVGAVPELVEDGVTGVLVNPGDVAGIVAAMRSLAVDGGLRGRLGAAALERAHRRWSIEDYGRALGGLILSCAQREVPRV